MGYEQIREVSYKDVNGLLKRGWQYIHSHAMNSGIVYVVGLPKHVCEHRNYHRKPRDVNPPTQMRYDPKLQEWFCIECAEAVAYIYDAFFEQYGRIPGGRPHKETTS